jgi:hypothetical protein
MQLAAGTGLVLTLVVGSAGPATGGGLDTANLKSTTAADVAAEVDRLVEGELQESKTATAATTTDEDFLRRISFDLAGSLPSPAEVTIFGLNPDPEKRVKLIDQLLAGDQFARNWARYWRDVIFTRATEQRSRIYQPSFERWMTDQLKQNRHWDEIATDLITATGDVRENGETGLIFAHGGKAAELASETSRIFLGIQIQCANCHDHPTDVWKREDFHQLAAYFPRIRVRRVMGDNRRSFEVVSFDAARGRGRGGMRNPEFLFRRYDANKDGKLTKAEVKGTQLSRYFDRLLDRGDTNKDKALSLAELKKIPQPQGQRQGTTEHYIPDLSDPSSRGTRVDPAFFVDKTKATPGLRDLQRRGDLAESLTSPENPWFARAFVNRIWGALLGQGFYMPIDDIGPERTATFPQVLDLLSAGFVVNDYNIQWLFRTIANTQAYQRQIQARDASDISPPFAAATPTRLRSDQLYTALVGVLGIREDGGGNAGRRPGAGAGQYRRGFSQRARFAALFSFDPSTPQEDITGTVPQALFLMNSPLVNNGIRGQGQTRLGRILQKFDNDKDALGELYLLVLSREPSAKEITIATEYIDDVDNRREAFEDLMWSLLNSSEFLSKR